MIALKDIAEAAGAALALCYVGYNELRLKKLERADEQLKRKLADVQIVDSVHSKSDAQLKLELDKELGGHSDKPKA